MMEGPAHVMDRSALAARIGTEIGVSEWIRIDQATIQAFADLTGDHAFIHVDPERARTTPFGTTIAHGFLTLSMLSQMAYQVCPRIEGGKYGVNYGCERLRFVAPVKSGARVRARFVLRALEEQPGNRVQLRYDTTLEIEGETKPALVIEWLSMTFF
jgi:acyl dehydratase